MNIKLVLILYGMFQVFSWLIFKIESLRIFLIAVWLWLLLQLWWRCCRLPVSIVLRIH